MCLIYLFITFILWSVMGALLYLKLFLIISLIVKTVCACLSVIKWGPHSLDNSNILSLSGEVFWTWGIPHKNYTKNDTSLTAQIYLYNLYAIFFSHFSFWKNIFTHFWHNFYVSRAFVVKEIWYDHKWPVY